MLTSLGIVLFHALDFGMDEDEERTLSKPLELLIERLTSADLRARRRRKRLHRANLHSIQAQNHQEMHSLNSFGETPSSDDEHDDDDNDDDLDDNDFDDNIDDELGNDEGIEDCHEFSEQFNSLQSTSTSTGTDSGLTHGTAHRDLYLADFDVILQVCE